jgi:hypothetical protein
MDHGTGAASGNNQQMEVFKSQVRDLSDHFVMTTLTTLDNILTCTGKAVAEKTQPQIYRQNEY